MVDEKKKRLCPEPDCGTENDADAEICSNDKCGLDLGAYFAVDRVFQVREKIAAKKLAEEDAAKPKLKGSVFGNLARGKK